MYLRFNLIIANSLIRTHVVRFSVHRPQQSQRNHIFSNVELLIYVFDVDSAQMGVSDCVLLLCIYCA
jgi:hypothetical protein